MSTTTINDVAVQKRLKQGASKQISPSFRHLILALLQPIWLVPVPVRC